MKKLLLSTVLAMSFSLSGCYVASQFVEPKKQYFPEKTLNLTINKTTKKQVLNQISKPDDMFVSSYHETWVYDLNYKKQTIKVNLRQKDGSNHTVVYTDIQNHGIGDQYKHEFRLNFKNGVLSGFSSK